MMTSSATTPCARVGRVGRRRYPCRSDASPRRWPQGSASSRASDPSGYPRLIRRRGTGADSASAPYAKGAFLFTRCDPTRTGASESLRRSRRRPRRRHRVYLPVIITTLSRSSNPRAARWRGCGSAAQTRRGGRARWSRSRTWCPISRSRSWRGSCRREMRTPSSRTYARRRRRGARTSGGSRARRGRPRGSQLCTRCASKMPRQRR